MAVKQIKTCRTIEDFSPTWMHEIWTGYEKGKSDAWARLALNITYSDWCKLLQADEMFQGVIKKGRDKCQDYYEDKAKQFIEGDIKFGSATMLIFIMKNRFSDYSERLELARAEDTNREEMTEKEIEHFKKELEAVRKIKLNGKK